MIKIFNFCNEASRKTRYETLDYYNKVMEKIASLTMTGRYFGGEETLYRGENEHFPSVSSGLCRYFSGHDAWRAKNENEKEQFLFNYEKRIVRIASIFVGYRGEDYSLKNRNDVKDFSSKQWELLANVQHSGGITNFIDFTRNANIALFFACYNQTDSLYSLSRSGDKDKDGRVILYHHGSQPEHDVLTFPQVAYSRMQSGVLVRPRTSGVIDIDKSCIDVVTIPSKKRKEILGYLACVYNIELTTIYSDLPGYVRSQNLLFPKLKK